MAAHKWQSVAPFLGFVATEGDKLLVKEFAFAFLIAAVIGTLVEVHAVRRHEELMEETRKKFMEFSVGIAQSSVINESPVARYCALDKVVMSVLGQRFAREDYSIKLELKRSGTSVIVDNQIAWTVKNLSRNAEVFEYRFQFDRLIRGARREPTQVHYLKLGRDEYKNSLPAKFVELKDGEPVCIKAPVTLDEGESAETVIHFVEHRTETDCSFWVMSMPCKSIELSVTCDQELSFVVEALHPGEPTKPPGSPMGRTSQWTLEGGLLPGQGILVRWAPKAS